MGQAITGWLMSNKDAIGIGSTVFGGATSAFGQFAEGQAGQEQALFQSAILRNNKYLSDQAAADALERGKVDAQEKQVETAQVIGAQQASFAGRGVVVNQDTAAELAVDTARIGTLDVQTIKENAKKQAIAYKMQGANFALEAKAAKAKGSSSFMSGLMEAGGTLLSTATSVAAKWAIYNKEQEALGK